MGEKILKINKFDDLSNKKSKSSSTKILFALTALSSMLIAFATMGCTPVATNSVSTELPSVTATVPLNPNVAVSSAVTPVATPEVTQTPVLTPAPPVELTDEEIIELLGIENPDEMINVNQLVMTCYNIKDESGVEITQIAWVRAHNDGTTDDLGNPICYVTNFANDKLLYSIPEIGKYGLDYLANSTPTILNKKLETLSPKIFDFTSVANAEMISEEFGYLVRKDTEEYKNFYKLIFNSTPDSDTFMSRLEIAKIYLAFTGYQMAVKSETLDEKLLMSTPTVVPSAYIPTEYETFTSKDGAANINYSFNSKNQTEVIADDNVIHGYNNPGYYNTLNTVTAVNQHVKTRS